MLAKLPSALGKGIIAGFAGTVARTISRTIEMKMRGRKASDAPARAASKVLGVTPVGETEKQRFSNMVHWGYGTGWGVPRGLLTLTGLPWPAQTAIHIGTVWGTEAAMLPALRVSPPPTQWSAEEVGIDLWHHLVYALGAAAAIAGLERLEAREERRRRVPRVLLADLVSVLADEAKPRARAVWRVAREGADRTRPRARALWRTARARVEDGRPLAEELYDRLRARIEEARAA